ncbi:hypothetical protein [Thalassotalea sediminis]|uniref:hypothetical protein n=1 Tax=Thalassotalea sediminis TaxID=1759089 RepID=UPI0025728BCE|nr:hypothetical protein [Thalassotalea sediminis]
MLEVNNLVALSTVVGGFATGFAAAFAIVGIPLTYIQIKTSKELHREGIAKGLYREYLADAINRPDFITPNIEQLKRTGKFVQYELFIAHMLYSLEEILAHTNEKEWENVVIGQLKTHIEYLRSEDFHHKRKYYDSALITLIANIT